MNIDSHWSLSLYNCPATRLGTSHIGTAIIALATHVGNRQTPSLQSLQDCVCKRLTSNPFHLQEVCKDLFDLSVNNVAQYQRQLLPVCNISHLVRYDGVKHCLFHFAYYVRLDAATDDLSVRFGWFFMCRAHSSGHVQDVFAKQHLFQL